MSGRSTIKWFYPERQFTWRDTWAMQPITLTDEQRQFREVMRQFAEDKIAPRRGRDRRARASTTGTSFKALRDDGAAPRSVYPEEYGGAGASSSTQAIAAEELARVCASTSLMLLISKLAMLPVINFGSEELKRTYLPRVCERRVAGVVLPVRGRRRQRRRLDDDAGGPRRRRLGDHGHEVLDHQRRHLRPLHRLRQDRPSAGHRGISAFLVEADWGVQVDEARAQAGHPGSPDRRSPPRRGPRPGGEPASARSARAFTSRCTPSTAPGRRSAPRRSASPRARSTTPSAT